MSQAVSGKASSYSLTQTVKNLPAMQETGVRLMHGEDPRFYISVNGSTAKSDGLTEALKYS